jgi:hypothetical protein
MKKQNVKNKLAFNNAAVTELNENLMTSVNGGSYDLSSFDYISLILIPVPDVQ